MLNWLIALLFTGHVHKWQCQYTKRGQYADTYSPFIINEMRCVKCGLVKLVEKS